MSRDEFMERSLKRAMQKGCGACEAYCVSAEVFRVGILEGEIDSYTASSSSGLGLRVQLDGKNGYAYTEAYDDADRLIDEAMQNAKVITTSDEHPMQTRQDYPKVIQPPDPLSALTPEQKIELAKQLEQEVKRADTRVVRVAHCTVATSVSSVRIKNTLGLDASEVSSLGYCIVSPVVQEGGRTNNAYAFRIGKDALDVQGCAKEAVEKAVSMLSATPIPAGQYRVLIENEAAADLLEAFSPMFSADNAQKGLSLLAKREGESIASSAVTIMDDPFHPDMPQAFDGEGTPCVKKIVVQEGRLNTLLHNLKTAKKANTASTGNAGRASAASPVGVSPTNFYILPGGLSREELIKQLDTGIFITDLTGLHAGVNTISGEFSLSAKGYWVKDGEIRRPVERIAAAGTFLGLMQGVTAVGNDVFFGLPGGGRIGSPDLLVQFLQISGEG